VPGERGVGNWERCGDPPAPNERNQALYRRYQAMAEAELSGGGLEGTGDYRY